MPTETQSTIYSWMNATFPGADPDSPRKSIRALEEMVELCLASGATPFRISDVVMTILDKIDDWERPNRRPEEIPAEAADVLIVLYGVAGMRGFDLHEEVDIKMKTNRGRSWRAMGDGTGYHIRETETS